MSWTSRATLALTTALTGLICAACGAEDDTTSLDDGFTELTLQFQATVGAQPAACGTQYSTLGTSGTSGELADARLYLSGVELLNSDDQWVPIELDETNWQHSGVGLLDFEDGSAGCSDSGNADLNDALSGRVPSGEYSALRFQVGLPYAMNHVDVATAETPLNEASLYWVWRGGYKFLRVDWLVDGGAVPRWNVHLGSTACVSAAPTQAPAEPCGRPNSPTVMLESFDPDSSAIQLDLANLLGETDVGVNDMETPPGCQSNPGEPGDCGAVFSSLGLSFDDGQCLDDCGGQSVFSLVQ